MNSFLVLIISALILCPQPGRSSSLPEYAKSYLNELPDRAITMDLVLNLAVRNSSSFKRVMSQKIAREAAYLSATAPLAWRLEGEAQRVNDESAINGFGPEQTEIFNYRLGVAKAFETGSQIQMDLVNVDTELTFPQAFLNNFSSFIGQTNFSEPRATLSLSQSLWKDSFGRSTRSALKAANLQRQVNDAQLKSSVGDWAVGISNLFYEAWLAQQKVTADLSNVKRQQRLMKIVNLQQRRGTSDKADVLQVKSSLTLAEQTLSDSRQQVNRIFKALVLSIGLPAKWLQVDGSLVPTKIDSPIGLATKVCSKSWTDVAEANPELMTLLQEKKASESQLEAAKGRVAPDVRALFSASANGVEPNFDEAFENVSQWNNPRYTVGLTVSIPLDMKEEKAEVLKSLTQKSAKEYELGQTKDDLRAEWVSNCDNIRRLVVKVSEFEKMTLLQQQRAQLEERRFRLGKVSAFQVIQAGSDATAAELNFKSSQVELRRVAWRVAQMGGVISQRVLSEGVE